MSLVFMNPSVTQGAMANLSSPVISLNLLDSHGSKIKVSNSKSNVSLEIPLTDDTNFDQ